MRVGENARQWIRTIAATDEAIAQIGLVDAPEVDGLSRLVRLAAGLLETPMALVSIVQPALDRQYFSANHGLEGPIGTARQTPLTYSFCRHVRDRGRPLIVTDAQTNPLVQENPSVYELGIRAYLGVPIHWPDGTTIGALCVADSVARGWTASDLERLHHLACGVDDQIRLLLAIQEQRSALTRAELAVTARDLMFREINHEFRTPLNGVIGAAEVLRETNLDEGQRQFLDLLMDSADQLTRIVEEVAALAYDLTGTRGRHMEAFDPAGVLAEVIGQLSHGEGACHVNRRHDGKPFELRLGDKLMLRHVLYDTLRTATTAWLSAQIDISVEDTEIDVLCVRMRSRPAAAGTTLPAPRSGRSLAAELRLARGMVRAIGGSLRMELVHDGHPETSLILRLPFAKANPQAHDSP